MAEIRSPGQFYKQVSIPPGLEGLLGSLSYEVLKKQPPDLYKFAWKHFEKLLVMRDVCGLDINDCNKDKLIAALKKYDRVEELLKSKRINHVETDKSNEKINDEKMIIQNGNTRSSSNEKNDGSNVLVKMVEDDDGKIDGENLKEVMDEKVEHGEILQKIDEESRMGLIDGNGEESRDEGRSEMEATKSDEILLKNDGDSLKNGENDKQRRMEVGGEMKITHGEEILLENDGNDGENRNEGKSELKTIQSEVLTKIDETLKNDENNGESHDEGGSEMELTNGEEIVQENHRDKVERDVEPTNGENISLKKDDDSLKTDEHNGKSHDEGGSEIDQTNGEEMLLKKDEDTRKNDDSNEETRNEVKTELETIKNDDTVEISIAKEETIDNSLIEKEPKAVEEPDIDNIMNESDKEMTKIFLNAETNDNVRMKDEEKDIRDFIESEKEDFSTVEEDQTERSSEVERDTERDGEIMIEKESGGKEMEDDKTNAKKIDNDTIILKETPEQPDTSNDSTKLMNGSIIVDKDIGQLTSELNETKATKDIDEKTFKKMFTQTIDSQSMEEEPAIHKPTIVKPVKPKLGKAQSLNSNKTNKKGMRKVASESRADKKVLKDVRVVGKVLDAEGVVKVENQVVNEPICVQEFVEKTVPSDRLKKVKKCLDLTEVGDGQVDVEADETVGGSEKIEWFQDEPGDCIRAGAGDEVGLENVKEMAKENIESEAENVGGEARIVDEMAKETAEKKTEIENESTAGNQSKIEEDQGRERAEDELKDSNEPIPAEGDKMEDAASKKQILDELKESNEGIIIDKDVKSEEESKDNIQDNIQESYEINETITDEDSQMKDGESNGKSGDESDKTIELAASDKKDIKMELESVEMNLKEPEEDKNPSGIKNDSTDLEHNEEKENASGSSGKSAKEDFNVELESKEPESNIKSNEIVKDDSEEEVDPLSLVAEEEMISDTKPPEILAKMSVGSAYKEFDVGGFYDLQKVSDAARLIQRAWRRFKIKS